MTMLLQGHFYHKGKKHRLTLTEESLIWDPEGTPDLRHSVLASEILSCWICPRGSLSCAPNVDSVVKQCQHFRKGNRGLTVEVCERREGKRWGASVFVFLHAAKEVVHTWYEAIWTVINKLPERPCKLLVIINPIGGRKKGIPNFNKKVLPIFRRALIRTVTLQTDCKGHGTALVQEAAAQGNLKDCDGIIAVGGDGLVSEIVTGLFVLASVAQGLDPNDYQVEFPFTQIRLGIIPSGSTDAICFATHGSNDVITAAVHIVMGDKRLVDVASVHSDNALHRVVTSLISYGYFGDLLRSSEHYRCLGPPRYVVSGVQQILRNRSYPVKISIKRGKEGSAAAGYLNTSDTSMMSTMSCNSICSVCSQVEDDDRGAPPLDDWEEIKGCYSVVSAAITSCSCRLTPQGVSPLAHLGDGFCDLILVEGSSRVKLLSYLYHTSVTGNATNLNHVKMIRTSEIHFAAPEERLSSFNCDGEELQSSFLSIKIHRKKLELFCRGVEETFPLSNNKFKTNL